MKKKNENKDLVTSINKVINKKVGVKTNTKLEKELYKSLHVVLDDYKRQGIIKDNVVVSIDIQLSTHVTFIVDNKLVHLSDLINCEEEVK